MRILMINKFLYPKGGSETYVFNLGTCLQRAGHEVQYFGMEHRDRILGNRVNAYTAYVDFHGKGWLWKLKCFASVIYSGDARKKIHMVLEDFQPQVCHLNNFNYQLTPSILLEIRKWERQTGNRCRIVYTAHDYQLLCPNHMCRNPMTRKNCEKCLGGHFWNCVAGRCIHDSLGKSIAGALEAVIWRKIGVYRQLDAVICCSGFLKERMDRDPVFSGKTVLLHNFVLPEETKPVNRKPYVLYFGQYTREKGVATLIKAAENLPQIPFVFAGSGPLEFQLKGIGNITDVGFLTGEPLKKLIREACFTVCPSEWYENCPYCVMESLLHGTPVLGAAIGGIPELILDNRMGRLFQSGSVEDLTEKLLSMWEKQDDPGIPDQLPFFKGEEYVQILETIYQGGNLSEEECFAG